MTTSDKTYPYDVALSYAKEDQVYAETLAKILKSHNVKVFYDQYEESTLWGENLVTYLTDLYQHKARYCVVFLSQHYAKKRWTKLELESAQARALIDEGYILPIRLDRSDVPGILPTIAYLNWIEDNVESIVNALLEKIGKASPTKFDAMKGAFWRYFISQALRLSLHLICEAIPNQNVGLVMPLQKTNANSNIFELLSSDGRALVGWLSRSGSSYMFLSSEPSLEYPRDYRIHLLHSAGEVVHKDRTLIVLPRKATDLTLSSFLVDTIRRILSPIYEREQDWLLYLESITYDLPYLTNDNPNSSIFDDFLTELADMIVHLGGRTIEGNPRWRFCCILQPKDSFLPIQQHILVVQAQSHHSPHKVGETKVSSDRAPESLCLRAYQSGSIIYHPNVNADSILFYEMEGPIHSALAMPIGGETGTPVGALYIASEEKAAFSESDQRVLRMLARMIEDSILTYQVRERMTTRLIDAIYKPNVVDQLFIDFLSESDFIQDVEDLLIALKVQLGEWKEPRQERGTLEEQKERFKVQQSTGKVVSFITVYIHRQDRLAAKYGNQVARNLSKQVGRRLSMQMNVLWVNRHKLYHLYAGRFCLLLKGVTLDEARRKAVVLKEVLEGDYRVEAQPASPKRWPLREDMLEINDVMVSLVVHSYPYEKLKEVLLRYPAENAVTEVRAVIMKFMLMLDRSFSAELLIGSTIMSWDVDKWCFVECSEQLKKKPSL